MLKADRIYDFSISYNVITCEKVRWPWYKSLIEYLDEDMLLKELEELGEHEIAADVRDRIANKFYEDAS